MPDEIEHHYRVLELDSTASIEDVKRTWRELAKVWHPDRFQGDPKLQHRGQEKLKEINAAYQALSTHLASGRQQEFQPRPQQTPNRQPSNGDTPKQKTEATKYFVFICTRCGANNRFPLNAGVKNANCGRCHELNRFTDAQNRNKESSDQFYSEQNRMTEEDIRSLNNRAKMGHRQSSGKKINLDTIATGILIAVGIAFFIQGCGHPQ